ncbi:MAG TPA: HPF/RaiA family ribosome-associated protein [Polyangiales bacterium]
MGRAHAPSRTQAQAQGSNGRGRGAHVQVAIRNVDGAAGARLQRWVHERLDRQLGKFAPQIERVDVRFSDVNGQKGGVDRGCMVHVLLNALPPVVVESMGETPRQAFDLAAARAERATRRNLEKHGVSTHKGRHRRDKTLSVDAGAQSESAVDVAYELEEEQTELLLEAAEPPATGHAGRRNPKHNDSRMTYALEDSTNGKPSRKSSRGSSNHVMPANGLTLRTKSATLSPKSMAARSRSRSN